MMTGRPERGRLRITTSSRSRTGMSWGSFRTTADLVATIATCASGGASDRTNGRKTARISHMDELDSGIIRLLQTDARQSNRELARRLGTAPSTCLERVRALTRRGIIRGYHADIDLPALNRSVQALISVQ